MTDDEMFERVKQALADNIDAALPDGFKLDYYYPALAAIEAMREPTEAMVAACHDGQTLATPSATWAKMINAVLPQPPEH